MISCATNNKLLYCPRHTVARHLEWFLFEIYIQKFKKISKRNFGKIFQNLEDISQYHRSTYSLNISLRYIFGASDIKSALVLYPGFFVFKTRPLAKKLSLRCIWNSLSLFKKLENDSKGSKWKLKIWIDSKIGQKNLHLQA